MEHYTLEDQLRVAIDRHSVADVVNLIGKGANLNAKDKHGLTPLHWAVNCNALQIAELLLVRGSDINAQNEAMDMTPLCLAAYNGSAAMVVLLLMHGADTEATDESGDTAYDTALSMENKDIASLLEEQTSADEPMLPTVQLVELQTVSA